MWQESRESLSKAKKLLQMKEESHAKALAKLSADWQATLEVQQSEYEVKLKALQTTLDANTEHFQQALLTKKEHQREQSQKEQELTHTIAQMQARIDSMQEQHQRMQEEREQMMTMVSRDTATPLSRLCPSSDVQLFASVVACAALCRACFSSGSARSSARGGG